MLSPLGTDVASTWEGILAGRSGIRRIDHFDTENFSTKFAGLVPDFAMDEYLSGKEARKMDVFVQYGMVAAIQALRDAGLEMDKENGERIGVAIGSGIGGLTTAALLSDLGWKVCVLEQHYNLGGLATWFKRKGGHVFDISLHGFPFGMKKTCRKYWGQHVADKIVQLDGIRFDNPQFAFETRFTREDFTDKLESVFGIPRTTVEAFFDHIRGMNFYDGDETTTAELFERFFPGEPTWPKHLSSV